MLEILNRYSHGLASIPLLHALRERGCLARMAGTEPVSAGQLAQEFSANRPYLDVALRMLVCLGWLRRTADWRFEATPAMAASRDIPGRIMDLYRFPFDAFVRGGASNSLEPWLALSERRWNSRHPWLPDFLDGLLLVPLMLSLRAQNRLRVDVDGDARAAGGMLHLEAEPAVRRAVERIFLAQRWAAASGSGLALNRAGRFIVDRVFITATVASYKPMLALADDLLFGNAPSVFTRDASGHETHVDRTLNVIGSGFQHGKYFAEMCDLVVRCFEGDDYASQPKYIVDMGCGDGTLLRRLYETVRDRTPRGKVLDAHPLIPIAADFNEQALVEASRTLAGIRHIAVRGDIGDPGSLLDTLRANGVEDLDRVLHVRSFLDHDRPYRPPQDREAVERRSQERRSEVYIDGRGNAIPPCDMIQSTVEHLQRWSEVVNAHGLIMIEVHCLPPDLTNHFLDESESFHFDVYHALSHQFLLDAPTFLLCAAEAGLFYRQGRGLGFPKNLGFTRISLSHFERRPYRIRRAHDGDRPAMRQMDEIWELRSSGNNEPEAAGMVFVLETRGRVAASVCCVSGERIQLTSARIGRDVPMSRLRDLVDFVEQYWLRTGADSLTGSDDCRSALSHADNKRSVAHAIARDVEARVAGYPFAAENDPRAAERELGTFSFRWLLATLQRMGVMCRAGESYALDTLERRLGIVPKYHRYFGALVRRLQQEGILAISGSQVQTTPRVDDYALSPIEEQVAQFKLRFQQRHPASAGLMNLTARCLQRFEEIVTGRVDIAEVVFPGGNMDAFTEIFRGGAVSDYFNRIVADAVEQSIVRLKHNGPKIRVLEIGAGTGATTAAILERLGPASESVEFCFSDISQSFLRNARRRFAERYPFIDYRLLNIEKDLSLQGFERHSFDCIVAANVVHDTSDIELSLRQLHRLLKPGGLLVMDEYTSVKDCLFFSGALLHGYWQFQDPERRLRDSCLLGVSQWSGALEGAGFAVVGSHTLPSQRAEAACSESVMLCEALGTTDEEPLLHEETANEMDRDMVSRKTEILALVEGHALALLGDRRAASYSAERPLMDMGLDSIELVELKALLERSLGVKLTPMFLFEHETAAKMAAALAAMAADRQLPELLPSADGADATEIAAAAAPKPEPAEGDGDTIAIVGMACRFPGGALSPESFWALLEGGKDGIVPMPAGRWRWPDFIDIEGAHKGIDRAGFLDRIDEFDASFFRTSPKEAKWMDPQQRFLLELSWEAMEDAGHRPSELSGRKIGVFVGACHGDYREVLTKALDSAEAYVGTGSACSLLANRLSYFYDFKGPSLTVDTACSSSLFALHDAVAAIRNGDCEQALVGAANLLCSPTNSISYYQAGMLSPTGVCRTFDEAANGYVRGEGAAMLLVKPLALALADGDSVYGLVKSAAVNHGGQAASLTAPKPEAQAAVIEAAWKAADVPLESIGYIEAHGTGTRLGDPVEIGGLMQGFQRLCESRGEVWPATAGCGIGSVKTTVGHLEGAAGMAGVIKVLMAMQHRSLPATLHFERLNPDIDLAGSSFYIVRKNQPWTPGRDEHGRELPLRAGVSSFGFGGANAHAVIEEYRDRRDCAGEHERPYLIPLSARNGARLLERARGLLQLLQSSQDGGDQPTLEDMAFTLQMGREAMEERVAFVVWSMQELTGKLQAYVSGDGQKARAAANPKDTRQEIETCIDRRDLGRLASLWVNGADFDWSRLSAGVRPRRVHLPGYPFARERYWVDAGEREAPAAGGAAVLHPLLHRNTSDLSEQRYETTLTGEEFFLADHQGKGKVLPAVAYLEMARAAMERALPEGAEGEVLELRETVWAEPVVVEGEKQVRIALQADEEGQVEYEIYSGEAEAEIVHCQGRGVWSREAAPARLDVERLRGEMATGRLEPGDIYATCARMGLAYGPGMQSIGTLHLGNGQVLAELRLPQSVARNLDEYEMHPSLMDGALQASVGLMMGQHATRLPFALERLRIVARCRREMVAWVRYAAGSGPADAVVKIDVDLCDADGNICIQMGGLSTRALSGETAAGTLLATPVWQANSVDTLAHAAMVDYVEHHVILCGLANVETDRFRSLASPAHCEPLMADPHSSIAQRYCEWAEAALERIQAILLNMPRSRVLLQIVVSNHREEALLAGLSGLVRTAALENPRISGQLILVPPEITGDELDHYLRNERAGAAEPLVRYEHGARYVSRWQEVPADHHNPPIAIHEQGVYLITGGLGGLGILFAQEILDRGNQTRVILAGRSPLSPDRQGLLARLSAQADRVSYRQVDLADQDQVLDLVRNIQREYGSLNGILHSAGIIKDNFILKKGCAEFRQVLTPKVIGTYNLDEASHDVALDFFVLFSSLAGAVGNPGQADYAAANAFMDQFAAYRNGLVAARERQGRTRSMNWPLWRDGGMKLDAASQEIMQQATGMRAMQTATGIDAFYRALASPYDQVLVAEGDIRRIRDAFLSGQSRPAARPVPPAVVTGEGGDPSLARRTQDYLREQLSGVLKLAARKIDAEAPLEDYGIDSILAMKLTNQLEKVFGPLSKTLLFEYQTIAGLAQYFLNAHPATVQEELGLHRQAPASKEMNPDLVPANRHTSAKRRARFAGAKTDRRQAVAIVGLAGRYPQADTLQEFWRNLQSGRDCITEIPSERWDHNLYYDPDQNRAGKTYSKWGGFIGDVDKFDPLFFNISPKEAALIDPQERLFLETAWHAIEDAGYTKEQISGSRVGVFAGVMWGQYELFGAESLLAGGTAFPSSSHASIANRVSYFFDFHGPSIAVDTMCSSSLTAIHLACEAIRSGEIDAAIAGGVNVTIHPYKYLSLSQGRFVASDGRCRSFGAGGDGYVPGEGVGALLLKPLENAIRDGDQVYAVIRSSSVNHGGKTNGYTVPNPNAQADLILDALNKAQIDPRTLSYVETHGTGTSLGDPIEITALSKAFQRSTAQKRICPIGSVKSNIGHLESAAGIAAVTKALLQFRNDQLVPSLHADPLNPNIDFEGSPFYVQTGLTEWKRNGHPRRVGVSSFGAGGSNAHLILEDGPVAGCEVTAPNAAGPEIFVLSARDEAALVRYAASVIHFLDAAPRGSLADVAYTSQVGRSPLNARLAVIATSLQDLGAKLNRWLTLRGSDSLDLAAAQPELQDVFYGSVDKSFNGPGRILDGPAGDAFLAKLLADRDLDKIAQLWTMGAKIHWKLMSRNSVPRRVSLPAYPFARERCWIGTEKMTSRNVPPRGPDTPDPATPLQTENKHLTYYYPQWIASALPAGDRSSPGGPVLILDPSEELFLAMKNTQVSSLPETPLILVQPGKLFQQTGPHMYVVNPEREEDFRALIQSLKSRGLLPGAIVHHCAEDIQLDARHQVGRQLRTGVYALLNLYKAIMKEDQHAPLKLVSVFYTGAGASDPLSAALGGFFRTLTLENPKYLAKTVEIQDGVENNGEFSIADKAGLVWDELCDPDWFTAEIRYRRRSAGGNRRHERFLNRLVPEAREGKASASPLRQNGVYVVTGGLGRLGLIVGDYLARMVRAKLVLVGRSRPNAGQEEMLKQLRAQGAEVLFVQADVSRLEDAERIVRETKARFSEINGVIHAAGVTRDAFLLKKTKDEMDEVLAPKVYATVNLDLATKDEPLDLFVLFSSVAGVMGNIGQCDYAYGNRFLDFFAETRESLRRQQQRAGRTLSIDWPLWEEGGMQIPASDISRLEAQTGISPLPTQHGLRCWEDFLRTDALQAVALYGVPSRMAAYVNREPGRVRKSSSCRAEEAEPSALYAKTEAYLKALIGDELKLSPERIGASERLESFGIDSLAIGRINSILERDLGALPKTLLYEHETVRELAAFLLQDAREALIALFGCVGTQAAPLTTPAGQQTEPTGGVVSMPAPADGLERIAIIGIHGAFPHSANLDEYWDHLSQGHDLIDLVPRDRWNHEEFYHPDPAAASSGHIYCKWGGFLDHVDKFDPEFFHISAEEARMIDPQERLFLESVWAALEDAGYTRESLKKQFPKARSADVGVFVGVTTNSYHLWGPEERSRGNAVCPSALPWSIANRVSYFFDFNGPSIPVDTACSSSLVAIHLACQSLRNRECQVAVAGGVNLYLHPSKYQSLCQRRMLSLDGKCHSYGAGDDGFVPGEGVGTLILKPLRKAVEDQDRIYAVIAGSAFDHSGRSNGYSAPNPNSQASLISGMLNKAGIHPETIGYVEGHGTGTQLGDSIEVAALSQAFHRHTSKQQFCPIGSVKANIGHSESAAGIAGVAKVILQMKNRQLAPSIHAGLPNPNIDFAESPFYLQRELSPWPSSPAHPRRALINSFGAGGVNASMVLEEYDATVCAGHSDAAGPYVFVLSAKTDDRLRQHAGRILVWLRHRPEVDLGSLCYSLQVCREAMEERLAVAVSGVPELVERLEEWTQQRSSAGLCRGSSLSHTGRPSKAPEPDCQPNPIELARTWADGGQVDWQSLYNGLKPRRMGLPTYPFARTRYWVSDSPAREIEPVPAPRLHPLVSYNSSTLQEVSLTSVLADHAFYAVDHTVNGEKVFPGAGFIEMACIAGNIAAERRVRKLTDIVWVRPLSFHSGSQRLRISLKGSGDGARYSISSFDDENEAVLYSEGQLVFGNCPHPQGAAADRLPVHELKTRCALREKGAAFYNRFSGHGLGYGASFQTIQDIYLNESFALSALRLPDHLKGEFGQYILHPSLIDGALQTVAGLAGNLKFAPAHLPFALEELEILQSVPQSCYAYAEYAGSPSHARAGIRRFHIRLLNEAGEVLVRLTNLVVREPAAVPGSPRPTEEEPVAVP